MMVSEGASTNLKFHLESVCLRSTDSFELLWEMVRAQKGDQEDAMRLSFTPIPKKDFALTYIKISTSRYHQ